MAQEKTFNIEEEFAGVDFHAIHLEKRFIPTIETPYKKPDKSIGEAVKTRLRPRTKVRAIYQMLDNEDFDREEIIMAYRELTIWQMAEYGGTGYYQRQLQHPSEN
jgi:hypothetical protein